MSFTVEKLPNIPVVVLVQTNQRIMDDIGDILIRLDAMLQDQTEPVFLVIDVCRVRMTLDELTWVASTADGGGELLHHPKVRENLMVTTDGMLKLAAKGLKCPDFGGVLLGVFDSQARALDYCQAQAAALDCGPIRARPG